MFRSCRLWLREPCVCKSVCLFSPRPLPFPIRTVDSPFGSPCNNTRHTNPQPARRTHDRTMQDARCKMKFLFLPTLLPVRPSVVKHQHRRPKGLVLSPAHTRTHTHTRHGGLPAPGAWNRDHPCCESCGSPAMSTTIMCRVAAGTPEMGGGFLLLRPDEPGLGSFSSSLRGRGCCCRRCFLLCICGGDIEGTGAVVFLRRCQSSPDRLVLSLGWVVGLV